MIALFHRRPTSTKQHSDAHVGKEEVEAVGRSLTAACQTSPSMIQQINLHQVCGWCGALQGRRHIMNMHVRVLLCA